MKIKYLLLTGISIATLVSCKKKNEPTRQDYLTREKWKIVRLDYKAGATGTWTDGFTPMPNCRKDDETIFQMDGIYLITEGATKCNPSDPSTVFNGTWSLSPDIKKIIFPVPQPEWVIEKLDETELIYLFNMDVGPVTYYHRVVMRH